METLTQRLEALMDAFPAKTALYCVELTTGAPIAAIREEQTLLVYGVLSCLRGLREIGCNGPVSEAIDKIERRLNIEAHRGGSHD